MNNIKDQENINQKVILLRLDLNVPLKNGVITDQTRIDKILPVINFLIKKKLQDSYNLTRWETQRKSKQKTFFETNL